MEDLGIEFTFTNENSFIYTFGKNRGHTLAYSKVNRCLFLSSEAKLLYLCICEYAYSDRRDCFPNQASLRLHLGWSRSTLSKYTKELRRVGLIQIKQERIGSNYVYHIPELSTVSTLVHSEVVYLVLEAFKGRDNLVEAVEAYAKSDLFSSVTSCSSVTHTARLTRWFAEFFSGEMLKAEEQPPAPTRPKFRIHDGIDRSASAEDKPVRKKKVPADIAFLPEWNVHHYASYIEKKYLAVVKLPMVSVNLGEKAALKKLIELHKGMEESLVKKIDLYIESETFSPKGVFNFCSNYVQQLLNSYLTTGSWSEKKANAPMADPAEYAEEMEALFERRAQEAFGGVKS
jgi:biotin operon repressor